MTTLIIGAGMAGLAAAYDLHQAGERVFILEARDRIGGRAYTNHEFADFPVEFGAELIHGHKVATWEWVNKLGLNTILWRKMDEAIIHMEDGRLLTMEEARQIPEFNITRSWDLPDVPAGEDESWGDYLKRVGFTDEQLQYVRRSFSNAVGDDMFRTSARAILEDVNDETAGEDDFRIAEGYDSIYKALAEGIDIHLNTPVKRVTWNADGVQVTAADGQAFSADKALITLPVGVLQAGSVAFDPPLPDTKQAAINNAHMGPVIKMIYLFDQPIVEMDISAIYSSQNPPMWWTPSFTRETGDYVWTAFFSGDWARELLALGEQGALQKGLETLRAETNDPTLMPVRMQIVNWRDDPYSMGGYSVVQPGHHKNGKALAAPTPPLYWAGEATAPNHQVATVHGAYLSGKRAAAEILNNP